MMMSVSMYECACGVLSVASRSWRGANQRALALPCCCASRLLRSAAASQVLDVLLGGGVVLNELLRLNVRCEWGMMIGWVSVCYKGGYV